MGRTRAATREHVINCAVQLFSEHGFENVPFNDIAVASGVDKATITRNFGDMEGLYNAVADRVAAIHLNYARLESAMTGAGDDEDLVILLTLYYEIFFEYIQYLRLYFMENVNQGSRRLQWPLVGEMRGFLASSIRKKDSKTQDDTPETIAGLLLDFVAKSVWRANLVEGCRQSTDETKKEFAVLVQPHLDACLLTLLPE